MVMGGLNGYLVPTLDKLKLAGSYNHHSQKQPAPGPTVDIGFSVGAVFVANRNIVNLEV